MGKPSEFHPIFYLGEPGEFQILDETGNLEKKPVTKEDIQSINRVGKANFHGWARSSVFSSLETAAALNRKKISSARYRGCAGSSGNTTTYSKLAGGDSR